MINLCKLIESVKSAESVDNEFSRTLWLLNIIANTSTYAQIPFEEITEDEILELVNEYVSSYLEFVSSLRDSVRKIPRICCSDAVDFI